MVKSNYSLFCAAVHKNFEGRKIKIHVRKNQTDFSNYSRL